MTQEIRDLRTLEDAVALLDEWIAASKRQYSTIVAMSEEITHLKLELDRAEARLTLEHAEQTLRKFPLPQRSKFEEMALDEADPFG